MKSTVFILLMVFVVLFMSEFVVAQPIDPWCETDGGNTRCDHNFSGTVFTPKCSPVLAGYDLPAPAGTPRTGWDVLEERWLFGYNFPTTWGNLFSSYWNLVGDGTIDLIELPNSVYNCHSYSFYCRDTSRNLFYFTLGDDDESTYWEDGSYYLIDSPEAGAIIYYNGEDHSGVVQSDGEIISKWGTGPLIKHPVSECPYNTNNRSYYKRNFYEPNDYDPSDPEHTSYYSASLNSSIEEFIYPSGDEDWFEITVTETNKQLVVRLAIVDLDYRVYFYDTDGNPLSSRQGGTSYQKIYTCDLPSPGVYYVKVVGHNGAYHATDSYRVRFELQDSQAKFDTDIEKDNQRNLRVNGLTIYSARWEANSDTTRMLNVSRPDTALAGDLLKVNLMFDHSMHTQSIPNINLVYQLDDIDIPIPVQPSPDHAPYGWQSDTLWVGDVTLPEDFAGNFTLKVQAQDAAENWTDSDPSTIPHFADTTFVGVETGFDTHHNFSSIYSEFPHVVSSTPREGQHGVRPDGDIELRFSIENQASAVANTTSHA